MVLLAAAAIAVALVPMLFAYLQLGYHPDVFGPQAHYAGDVERTLDRALVDAAAGIPADHGWGDRRDAVTEVREGLEPTLSSLNRSALDRGTAIQVSFNASLASDWEGGNCPGGPGRRFGPCRADRGVVVQQRAGETHVVAAAFDVRVTTRRSETHVGTVVERTR